MSQKSKPWYLSRELLLSALMLVAGVLQIAGTISDAESFGAGVKAVDWQAWALSAAGLLWGILRIANGISEESSAQPLRGPSTKRTLALGALLALGLPLLFGLVGCGVFVHEVSCDPGQAPSAVILPAPDGVAADGVAVARCGVTEVERWTCEVRATVECGPQQTSVLCVGRDGHERRMTVVDPDGVVCTRGGTR